MTVISDIDGVLADNQMRLDALDVERPDWVAFHKGLREDPLVPGYPELLRAMFMADYKIILITNRYEMYRAETEAWLDQNDIGYDDLYMRQNDQPYATAKLFNLLSFKANHHVMFAIDDDPTICGMYTRQGIPVIYVHSGYYGHGRARDDRGIVGSLDRASATGSG